MMRAALILAFVGGMAVLSAAQTPSPAFDVASVKPSGPVVPWGIGRVPPGQWRAARVNLVQLINAGFPDYGFEGRVIGGPTWVREALFDIDARMDPGITPAEVKPLIARLLTDRFALRTHVEQRPVDVYLLKMAHDDGRLGPQLKRSDPSCVEARTARQVPPRECRGLLSGHGMNLPTSQMAEFLRALAFFRIDRPILDRTGLTGYFDFQLGYQCGPFTGPFHSRPCGTEAVSFFTALREQSGLTLEAAREMVDVLVIDSVERPTPD